MDHASLHRAPTSDRMTQSPARQAGPTQGPALRIHAPDGLPDGSPPEPSLDWTVPQLFCAMPAPSCGSRCMPKAAGAGHRALPRGRGPLAAILPRPAARRRDARALRPFRPLALFAARAAGTETLFRWSPRWRSWRRVGPACRAGLTAAETELLLGRPEHDYALKPPIAQNTVRRHCNRLNAAALGRAADEALPARGRPVHRLRCVGPAQAAALDRRAAQGRGRERIFTRAEIVAWLGACRYASSPAIGGITPEAWWRALLTLLYYTSCRIGTALAARYDWIGEEGLDRWLDVPGAAMKSRRPESLCLKPAAMAALESIRRPGREVIFAWPWPPSGSRQQLYQEKNRLFAVRRHPGRAASASTPSAPAAATRSTNSTRKRRQRLCHRDSRTTKATLHAEEHARSGRRPRRRSRTCRRTTGRRGSLSCNENHEGQKARKTKLSIMDEAKSRVSWASCGPTARIGPATKLAFTWLWRQTGGQPADYHLDTRAMAKELGRDRRSAWDWLKELRRQSMIEYGNVTTAMERFGSTFSTLIRFSGRRDQIPNGCSQSSLGRRGKRGRWLPQLRRLWEAQSGPGEHQVPTASIRPPAIGSDPPASLRGVLQKPPAQSAGCAGGIYANPRASAVRRGCAGTPAHSPDDLRGGFCQDVASQTLTKTPAQRGRVRRVPNPQHATNVKDTNEFNARSQLPNARIPMSKGLRLTSREGPSGGNRKERPRRPTAGRWAR